MECLVHFVQRLQPNINKKKKTSDNTKKLPLRQHLNQDYSFLSTSSGKLDRRQWRELKYVLLNFDLELSVLVAIMGLSLKTEHY